MRDLLEAEQENNLAVQASIANEGPDAIAKDAEDIAEDTAEDGAALSGIAMMADSVRQVGFRMRDLSEAAQESNLAIRASIAKEEPDDITKGAEDIAEDGAAPLGIAMVGSVRPVGFKMRDLSEAEQESNLAVQASIANEEPDDIAKDAEDAEDIAEDGTADVAVMEEARWHKGEFSEVKAAYMMRETSTYSSWVASDERKKCLSRMPLSELKRRRILPPQVGGAQGLPEAAC